MSFFVDARIPVVFASLAEVAPDDAVLAEGGTDDFRRVPVTAGFGAAGTSGHPVSCACCVPRSDAAQALGRLFLARARGDVPFFRRVVAPDISLGGANAVRAALETDPLVSGRFRLG